MEDSFRVRVDKVFGSLNPSSTSSSLRSLWSLTDEEVEKKEWNRERDSPDREDNPCSSSFDGFFSNQRKISEKNSRKLRKDLGDDLDDEDEDEQRGQSVNSDGNEKDEWDIRSSIGLDCTLDREEEEDEYDKVALGRENAGERLFMKDITDYGPYLNSHNVLPDSFKDHERDSRANYLAARNRLKEDEEAAGGVHSFSDYSNKMPTVDSSVTEDGGNLKSILKRKENQADTKSQKRVRFDSACADKCEEELEGARDSVMINCSMETTEDSSSLPQGTPGVPDYVRNPSKYTRYSFDMSSEVDEDSNQKVYVDFLNMIKRSKTPDSQLEGPSADLPKSVTFIPKKKAGDVIMVKDSAKMKQSHDDASKESIRRSGIPSGIAAVEAQENEVCAMEEDEPETATENKSGSSHKPCRQYRSKVRPDDSVA